MNKILNIAVDAMGGEGSPKKAIDGIMHHSKSSKNINYNIFGDEKESYCQRIRRLSEKGNFPKPTIPSNNGAGRAMWLTPLVEKWYMEQIYEQDNSVKGLDLNTD